MIGTSSHQRVGICETERPVLLTFTKAQKLGGSRVARRFLGDGPCAWKGAVKCMAGTEWPEHGALRVPP